MEEDIKILENYLDGQDRKFVSEYRLKFLTALENLLNQHKENTCLHCGNNPPKYCEKCYQELIATNAKLQRGE